MGSEGLRMARVERVTNETDIVVELLLDGSGKGEVDTTVPFMDHMLQLFSRHGLFDLTVKGRGDTAIDDHHLVEDLGICLGQAFSRALGDKEGIARYGQALVPMDESLCQAAVDLSGRPFLVYRVRTGTGRIGDFDPQLLPEFFKAFTDHCACTLHIDLLYGRNSHHKVEAVFKAFARVLDQASSRPGNIRGVLSTKGTL
ncbi:MAG TPA: imidazoleglycerol-phosphate dehydratase HisB [Syntrophales bacterium]|nr:imidazoleglycerol-phosphate dehydratase HisB [Syntrophales bacterium]HRS86910.1 imidazoleglycerol-phosphate dehydratase HisB [Syntrophales bacterium]HRV42485.1 imidazoleglycerol-phosphate dehydratase HisB [Syntrophales bacterium]